MGSVCIETAPQTRHKFIRTQKNLVFQFLLRPRLILPIRGQSTVAAYSKWQDLILLIIQALRYAAWLTEEREVTLAGM